MSEAIELESKISPNSWLHESKFTKYFYDEQHWPAATEQKRLKDASRLLSTRSWLRTVDEGTRKWLVGSHSPECGQTDGIDRVSQSIDEDVELIVVFEPGTHPLTPLLKRGFGHCWAAKIQGNGYIYINPAFSHTQVAVVDDHELLRLIGEHPVLVAKGRPRGYRVPGIFSCVEAIKGLLGISSPIITPYQLYKYLR